jgi:hypothetical protein
MEVLLKNDHGKEDECLTMDSNPPSSSPISSSVRFQPRVQVHVIPHRNEYSSRVKRTLWMPPIEIEAMVTRNAVEFASEGWDWRRAAEEEDFVFLDKEWIHPAHLRRCNMQRQFLMIMSARQQQQQQQMYHNR